MKRNCLLILLAMLAYSCSTYRATVTKQESLSYDAIRVHPGWRYQNPKARKMILPLIGGVVGGIYGSQNQTIIEGDTLAESENTALWAVGGAAAGGILNKILFPSRRRRSFDVSQSDKWIRKYNRASGKEEYLVTKAEANNTLVLVPRKNVLAFRQKYQRLERDLESATPTTDFNALQAWEAQLAGEYSILPNEEIRYVRALLETHQEKIATQNLLKNAEALEFLDDSYSALKKANAFLTDNRNLLQHASPASRTSTHREVEAKIGYLLDILVAQEMSGHTKLSISDLNAFSNSFNGKYSDFSAYHQVKEANEQISKTKEDRLLAQLDQVKARVMSAKHVKDVAELERLYLYLLEPSESPQVADLSRQMAQRKTAIKKEKRLRKEREIRERELAEARALARYGLRFRTDGLSNLKLIQDIFYGNFTEIPYDRDNLIFVGFIKAYMYTKAQRCPSSSAYDQVQIMEKVCETERVERINGIETNRYCVEWVDSGTGLYTSPALYHAYQTVTNIVAKDALPNLWKMLGKMAQGGIGSINADVAKSASLKSDIQRLVQINGCNNQAMERFEANLIQFATNNSPIRLDGRIEQQRMDYDEEQDLEKLVKDLVYADSKGWAFEYVRNSVRHVQVTASDEYGRPKQITASYQFNGLSNGQTDQVTITFKEGLPDCIYYLNYSSDCETPNRKVVADFVAGRYIVED